MNRNTSLALMLLGVVLTAYSAAPLQAQLQGEVREFLVPAGTPVSTGVDGDVILITGKPQGAIGDATGFGDCAGPGDHHIHDVTLVDPGAGRAARRLEIIVLDDHLWDTLRPGARLGNLTPIGSCLDSGSVLYNKYRGTVE